MVKRLIEQDDLDGVDRQLADLFRAATPVAADPFRKRRILVRVESASAPRAARFWMRPLIVAAVLVSGTATAALGHRYVFGGSGLLARLREPSPQSGNATPRAALPKHAANARLAPSAGSERVPEAPPLAAAASVEPQASPARAAKSVARPRADSPEDATRVVEAIQALRKERDPARAQSLLDDYLRTHPRGQLSGDALALSIEAASARHDPRAVDYARRYLALYPQGEYRDLAKRALVAPH